MTRDRRLLLLLGLLMAYGLFVVEGRYQREDKTTTEARHRHRHRHESSNRRGHHEFDRRSWQEVDYEYDGDSEDPIEDDYETRSYYDHPRSHHRSAQKSYHNRMFEPRYPSRYHNDGYFAGSGWYDENNDRRRIPSRYNTKNYRYRPGRTYHRPAYSHNRDVSDFDDDMEKDYDHERPHKYGNNGADKHYERWRNSRRYVSVRRDWRNGMNDYHGTKRHRLENGEGVIDHSDVTSWTDDWKKRSNFSDSKYHFSKKKNDRKTEEDEDYEDHGGLEEDDKDENEDDIWKDIDNERNKEEDNKEEKLDNNFYKNETKSSLKIYDDIIRKLTSDDPTTPKTTVKRDNRNIESNKHVKRDGYKNFKYEPKNVSGPIELFTNAPHVTNITSNYFVNKRTMENSTVKSIGHKPSKNMVGRIVNGHNLQEGKTVDTQAKTKSLEQDYEYLNNPDNEKEEDLVKTRLEDDSVMQADVTNTDYTDDGNGDEEEVDTTTATTTTTTTTTTMAPKLSLNQHYDYKDSRAYDGGTGAQYNGYQAKNDYPPMSAHSVHKWQSLGTREGVKETRSNMQQYNKNGKSAEIREALQHAIKVNKEGSCQWPRARVIPVRDVYPSPSTTYIPHCAILHRCSDDTGCCKSEAFTCMPKDSHRVELSFYTTSVGRASVVEKLSFYNHTKCECRERSEYDTMNEKPVDQRVYRHQSSSPPQNMKKPPSRKPCRCPSEFTPRLTMEGVCQCNCYESNENCIRTRRGKAYFSLADRICIQNNECTMPNCEFGEYIRWQGKCPRKKDTFDAMSGYHTNLNHRFRS